MAPAIEIFHPVRDRRPTNVYRRGRPALSLLVASLELHSSTQPVKTLPEALNRRCHSITALSASMTSSSDRRRGDSSIRSN
jgi:hypothetical protein